MTNHPPLPENLPSVEDISPFKDLLAELRCGLTRYWEAAHALLKENGVTLFPPGEQYFAYSKNFFSLLFLYSFFRAKIPEERRILYASTLQCLRGMVTGCDNLLDDEYKMTLDTDIVETGYRFRSVIDIMISDRVLFQILLEASQKGMFPVEKVVQATNASMHSMTQSGVQEASEEQGINEILSPELLLKQVHHHKTGILFTCPWDIPLTIEQIGKSDIAPLKEALYSIGMGCQVMDDIVDFGSDLQKKRHNYLVSLIHHQSSDREKMRLFEVMVSIGDHPPTLEISAQFPEARAMAVAASRKFLESGLHQLFRDEHAFLVEPAMVFLQQRIGVSLSSGSQ